MSLKLKIPVLLIGVLYMFLNYLQVMILDVERNPMSSGLFSRLPESGTSGVGRQRVLGLGDCEEGRWRWGALLF